MKYFIGIDGGGTKSRLLAVDQDNKIIGSTYGLSTNLASNSKEYVYNSIKNIVDDFLKQNNTVIEDCLGVCIGSAGLDTDNSVATMKKILMDMGFTCRVIVVNDGILALTTVTKGKPGVVVISGTGSVAYGMDSESNTFRCGGWGHALDDVGSGYWMGKEALKHALRSFDGRGEKTVLEEVFREKFQISDLSDCIEHIYNNFDKAEIASYALYVKEYAKKNDKVCIDIIDKAAKELYLLVNAILKRMSENAAEVIVSGGAILSNEMLFASFCSYMKMQHPDIRVLKIEKEPVWGAIYMMNSQFETQICQ